MIITITKVETATASNGNEYRKVTGSATNREGGVRETTKNILDNLKDKWPLLVENATLEFRMEQKGKFWNVIDIKKLTAEDLPGTAEKPVDTPKLVDQASKSLPIDDRTLDIHQQVAVKEIGEGWRCGSLAEGEPSDNALIKWYKNWLYKTTGIDVHYK